MTAITAQITGQTITFDDSVLPAGPSAYDVAVANGFVGTESEWLLSLKGEAGDDGADGEVGATGAGVPAGGTIGQALRKASNADHDTEWFTTSGGSGTVKNVITDYGAVGNFGADDTAAFQAALNAGVDFHIPPGTYKITGQLTQDRAIRITGSGVYSTLKGVFGTAPSALWKIAPGASNVKEFGLMQGFMIDTQQACPAVIIDTTATGSFANRWAFRDMWFYNGKTSGSMHSFELCGPSTQDNLFCSVIENCVFQGGLKLLNLGDSVLIRNNTIRGYGKGIEMTHVPGATHCGIENNNITSRGSALDIGAAVRGLNIERNNIENSVGGALHIIHIHGTSSNKVIAPMIRGNTINSFGLLSGGYATVILEQCEGAVFDENLCAGAGTAFYVPASSGNADIRYGRRNKFYGVSTPYSNGIGAAFIVE